MSHPQGEHKKTSLASGPWNSHSEDGGPVCLLPCLKSSVGLLLPFFLSPLHVKYCEEIALALFRLCCLKCTAQQSSSPHCCCLPRHTVSFHIPRSSPPEDAPPAALLNAWNDCVQIFLLDVSRVLALGLIGRMRKASHRTSRGLSPTKDNKEKQ